MSRLNDDRISSFGRTIILTSFKGIFHPKMYILSLITHPHVAPNMYDFLLLDTKEDT